MKSLFSVPTARLLCFSSSLCSTLAQINPLPGTGIVLHQKIKTMLKSLVPVALFYALLFNALSSKANSGEPVVVAVRAAVAVRAENAVLRLPAGGQVTKFVNAYIRSNDEDLSLARQRSQRPFTVIDSIFREYGLPIELKYLAVIESDLKTAALSRVGARGPWQLMPSTARDLGLKVNRRSDERTNYYKSTKAAALYLRDLHNEFKDWLLVLAAYNAGPVPVNRAIRLAGSRNFWVLQRYLPAESRQHVKRFIATAYYFVQAGQMDTDPVLPADVAGAGQGGMGRGLMVRRNGGNEDAGDYAYWFASHFSPAERVEMGESYTAAIRKEPAIRYAMKLPGWPARPGRI
jgi:hypothetical protein